MDNQENKNAAAPVKATEIYRLDYTLKTPEERAALVEKITKQDPSHLTEKYLEILADYILAARTKEDKKDKTILTTNRLITINKRETSYEDLVSKFENGEDGVYNIISDNKSALLSPKIAISAEDLDEFPELRKLKEKMAALEKQIAAATGKKKYILKKTLIEMRRDQYVLKQMFKQPLYATHLTRGKSFSIDLYENITFDENGDPVNNGPVSFFNPKHVSAILCNYDILKEGLSHSFSNDFYYLLEDFDKLCAAALVHYPMYRDIIKYKIAGKSNLEIQAALEKNYNIKHSVEYISALWRKKIPKIITDKAKEDYLIWYYTYVEKGAWKRCSKCGQVKLANYHFFSKNNTSKDGWYSMCKECRNKKKGE